MNSLELTSKTLLQGSHPRGKTLKMVKAFPDLEKSGNSKNRPKSGILKYLLEKSGGKLNISHTLYPVMEQFTSFVLELLVAKVSPKVMVLGPHLKMKTRF